MRLTVYLITALIVAHNSCASTNETMKQAETAPLVINSKNGLVCDKEKLVCTAEGNVKVAKGPYEMYSKEAIAFMNS
jgi:lipopolysaccharide export system protein LptA